MSHNVARGARPAVASRRKPAARRNRPPPFGRLRPVQRPVEPPASRWNFPASLEEIDFAARDGEIVGVGADLEPGTLLAAYRAGLFPMPVRRGVLAWWSPEPRGILPL